MPADPTSTVCPSREAERQGAPVGRRFRASLVNSLSGLATSAVTFFGISRLVDPAEYGRVAVVLAVWGLLGNTVDWCGALVMRFGPEELLAHGRLSVTVATRLLFAAPVVPLVLLGVPLVLWQRGGWPAGTLFMTATWIVVATLHNVLNFGAIAAQRFWPLTFAAVVCKGAPLLALGLARALTLPVRAEVMIGATFTGTVAAVAVLSWALRDLLGWARPSRTLLGEMWRYALPSLLGMPALAAIAWLDPLLLDRYAPRAEVGCYQLAYPAFTVFAMLGASLNSVLSPELVQANARRDGTALDHYRGTTQPALALVLGTAAFAAALWAGPLVGSLLPHRYAPSAELLALLCVAGGFLLAFWTLHPLVTATDSVWWLQLSTILQAITNVVLDLALTPGFGARGIAVANIAAWAVAFATLTLGLRRRIGVSVRPLAPLGVLGALVTLVLSGNPRDQLRLVLGLPLAALALAGALRTHRKRR